MSDYIERLMGRGESGDFFGDLPPAKSKPRKGIETRAVRRDSFDRSAWDQITDQVPALGEQVAQAQEEHPTAGGGYEDLFNLLNQGDPRFHKQEAMKPEYVVQRAMEQGMFDTDDFKWVRNQTRFDEYNTALAMLSMKEQMADALETADGANEALDKARQELDEAMQAARVYIDGTRPYDPETDGGEGPSGPIEDGAHITLITGAPPGAPGQPVTAEGGEGEPGEDGEPVSGTGVEEQEVIDRLEAALKGMGEAEQQSETAGHEAAAQVKAGVTEARTAIENEQAQASSYGLNDGNLRRMNFEERRALAERLNRNRIARFAKLLGAVRMEADAESRRRVTGVPAEIYDIEFGNSIHRMVASEVTNLAMPELEDLFWIRFAQKRLMQWETRGAEKMGRGPIIVVCDESGSMGASVDDEGNTREAWSKAVALALCDQAKRGQRDFVYIGFSSARQVWETRFTNGVYDWQQIMEFGEHFWGGGTSYEGPLTRAMEIIGTYEKARKPKPDVVFITDAECDVSEAFIKTWGDVKERADVRCYGIQIGGSGYYNAMHRLVDRCIEINQLNANPQAVTEMFRTI